MMNKNLIALFIAIATVGAISADCYRDRDGLHCDDGIVRESGYVARDAVEGSADVVAGTIGSIFGGRNVSERIEDRQDARDAREARRNRRYYRD